MYWIEWMLWHIQTSPHESEQWQDKLRKIQAAEGMGKGRDNFLGIPYRASETPSGEGSIYEVNERYIELIAGESQERRGLITYISIIIGGFLFKLVSFAIITNTVWFTGIHPSLKTPATAGGFALGIFMLFLTGIFFYVTARYARTLITLENFVQRRMLIRFNRVTRQVYLHRPRFAGGVTVFAWEQVSAEAVVGEEESANIGRKLILSWGPSMPDLPHLHVVFVGKRADGTSDIVNLWEFIRRYMEEGPQSVPVPKKMLSKVPWPWLSVMASLSFFRPLWRAGMRWQVACWVALTSPAFALHAVGHWISLLLCWEPRWPRIIREAGLPGKPVPPLSTAADWPPLPEVGAAGGKPRPARRPAKSDAQLGEQASQVTGQSMSEAASDLESDARRKELK
ncbi:DUF6708 domain-containing protein [Pseudomonas sp. Irchel 3E13]|uniref:DUF6708 domain-containing protein n=1 Tax=Pseudomonas sp. Irchel 3E13 TaxID=2008975 RepID=UPI00117B5E45|nr:DUF6708 domain-containing protein [Pseudomonas sp. Irchel 3E13]